jgi:hypothetical protein
MLNIFIQNLLQKGWRKRTKTKKDDQDPNVFDRETKIS